MTNDSRDVFLLWHTNPDNDDDEKLIGVYSKREKAKVAMLSLKKQPGFKEHPGGFEICPYRLDLTSWTEGFITIKHTSVRQEPGRTSTPPPTAAESRPLKKKKKKT